MSNLNRRGFLGAVTASAALPYAAAMGDSADKTSSMRTGRPKNVLLLMADQHRPEALGIRGGTVAKTPNLDRLARSGVRFEHSYCADPVCTPSRACLMTGLYVHNNKTYDNATPWPFEHKTMADYFGRAGYMTALVGKMHFVDAQTHGFNYKLDFNDWYQYLGPKTRLRAEEIIYPNSGSGLPQIDDLWRDYGDPWTGFINMDQREGYVSPGRVSALAEQDHFESFVARESIRFLRNFGKKEPFFLVSSFLKPHDPFMPTRRFADMFRAEEMKLPPTLGKVDLSTIPKFIRERIEYNAPIPELHNPEHAKRLIALYYANLAQMDYCAGQVLDELKELGLEEDTIVLYTSDHGGMLGMHGLWQKSVFYEPSVGVPLLFRVPGLTPPNSRCETPVSLVQLLPTLTELCDIPIPAGIDGASFATNLREPDRTEDTTVFAEHGLASKQPGYMIRHGNYKYCYYPNDMPELYDLRTDPDEMKNLALSPAHKGKVNEMQQKLFSWHRPSPVHTR
ncbi:MAG TPA: sulfatase-like hydrolase/transferase [Bryobacteraceae bacterium]|nr:sulfatase-like hydrolase/transferase [Bryobacteraceae bacterium]